MQLIKLSPARILTFVSSFTVLAATWACSSVDEGENGLEIPLDSELAEQTETALGELEQPLTGTHKVCSAVGGGSFRDTIVVPNGWDANDCLSFSQSIGLRTYNLACISDDGFLGFGSGSNPPAINPCKW